MGSKILPMVLSCQIFHLSSHCESKDNKNRNRQGKSSDKKREVNSSSFGFSMMK